MTKKIRLSGRLKMIADMVTAGNRLADIGTDHGYLPIYLLQTGRVPYAIAMDIREGPLMHAKTNVQKAGVSGQIDLRLSDGLAALNHDEADSIVISGMGGILIKTILEQGKELAREAGELVLSPQSDIPLFRTFLRSNGFRITDEDMVRDAGKYYVAIKAVYASGPDNTETMETYEDRYGPVLLKKRPEAFLSMLQAQKEINEAVLQSLKQANNSEETTARIKELSDQQAEISQILNAKEKESEDE